MEKKNECYGCLAGVGKAPRICQYSFTTHYHLSHRSTKFPAVLNFRVVDLNQVWRALQEMAEAKNLEELSIHLKELFLKSLVEEGGEKIPVS